MKMILIILALAIIGGGAFFFIKGNSSEVVYQQDLETPEGVAPAPGTTAPKTKVTGGGFNAEVTVSPSVDNVVSGVVTVTLNKSPVGTNMAFFAITGGSIAEAIEEVGPNLGIDTTGSDGWTILVDTTEYENGLYEMSGIAASGPDSDPLGVATAQVVIEN